MEREATLTLTTNEGQDVDFMEIAQIYLEEETYLILQPVELFDGMDEDEALVFHVTLGLDGTERLDMVYDEELTDKVFEEYEKLVSERCS